MGVISLSCLGDHLAADFLVLWLFLTVFLSCPPPCFLHFRCVGLYCRCISWLLAPYNYLFSPFGSFVTFVMGSICSSASFFHEVEKLQFSMDKRISILNALRRYAGLVKWQRSLRSVTSLAMVVG